MRKKLVLVSIVIILLAIVAFVCVFTSGKAFLFTKDLAITSTTVNEPDNDYYEYISTLNESQQGNALADVYVRVSPEYDGQYQMLFQIAQVENCNMGEGQNTQLDSLRLQFNSFESGNTILMSLPEGGPWNPMIFHQTEDGRGVILDNPNLGFMGTGSITLDFYVRPWQATTNPLSFDVAFSMHKTGVFKLTKYEGETHFDIKLPKAYTPVSD